MKMMKKMETTSISNSVVATEAISCKLGDDIMLPNSWNFLNNQSTFDVFYNKSMLTNIRKMPMEMEIHYSAGVSYTNIVGNLAGYRAV